MSIEQFLKAANKTVKQFEETSEAEIEAKFVKYAKSKGCTAYKLAIIGARSFPDRTVLCPEGKIFFVEFKKKGKKLSKGQEIIKRLIINLGFNYNVCDEIGQAEQILDKTVEKG